MSNKVKIKQLTSNDELKGKTILTDGNGKFIYDYPISKGDAFPSSPSSGETFYRTDIDELFYYDISRTKWLSVKKTMLSCGRNIADSAVTCYMYVGNAVQSSISGFKIPYDGTILSVSLQNTITATTTRILDVRINNSTVNRIQMNITNGNNGSSLINGNLDFTSGDLIQCLLLSGGDTYNDVIVVIEIARRI